MKTGARGAPVNKRKPLAERLAQGAGDLKIRLLIDLLTAVTLDSDSRRSSAGLV